MLGGSGFRRSAAAAATVRQRARLPLRSHRSLSSFATGTAQSPLRMGRADPTSFLNSLRRPAIPSLPRLASARFNSTSTGAAAGAATGSANASPTTPSTELFDSSIVSDLPDIDISHIPEKIGYLKELGLDYGWGPSSIVQTLLESIHIYSGIPWCGSVVATALVIRLGLFYSVVHASDTSSRLHEVKPLLDPVRERMTEFARAGDQIGAMREKKNAELIQEEHGIKTWKAFVPFLQIPLGYGCFRVLRGMAALPVPALETEHVLWLTDLTVRDPTFLIPIATGAMMFYAMKRGGETGAAATLRDTEFGKVMIYGLPAISTLVTAFFPSLLQLYFCASSAFAVVQTYFLNSPTFRRRAGIAPLPSRNPSAETSAEGRLRMISDRAAAARVSVETSGREHKGATSIIDRAVDSLKTSTKGLRKEAQDQMDKFAGTSTKNADGTPKPPPKKSEKELNIAESYEYKRREEAAWARRERNMRIKEQYQYKKPGSKPKQRK